MTTKKKPRKQRHAGRYNTKRAAEEWAEGLRQGGLNAEVVPVTCYDVVVTPKEGDAE